MKTLSLLILLSLTIGCDTNQTPPGTEVILVDLTGLDGCGWAFQLPTGDRLEPSNLHDFEVELIDSAQYSITYEMQSAGSICMVGDIVQLLTIHRLDQ